MMHKVMMALLLIIAAACTPANVETRNMGSLHTPPPFSIPTQQTGQTSEATQRTAPPATPTPVSFYTQTGEPAGGEVQPAATLPATSFPTRVGALATPLPQQSPALGCANDAEFIRHLSISDGTVLLPGQAFGKVWRVQNTGACRWSAGYQIVWSGGTGWQEQPPVALPAAVEPGATLDVRLGLLAPLTPGEYQADFHLADAGGRPFGPALLLRIVVRDPNALPPGTLNCG